MCSLFSTGLILQTMWVSCELLCAGAYASGALSWGGPYQRRVWKYRNPVSPALGSVKAPRCEGSLGVEVDFSQSNL